MFRKVTNCGLICILHADNDAPLKLWNKKLRDGKLKRVSESEMKGLALDFTGKVPYINYLSCPANVKSQLGIRYPFLVMTAKAGDGKFFAFDVQVIDDTGTRRRFRLATGQVPFEVQPFYCRIPLVLEDGWNNVVVPLHHLTREIYGTRFVETLRLQVYPSCRIKKLYFADRDYDEDELPREFQHDQSPYTEIVKRNFDEIGKSAPKLRSFTPEVRLARTIGSDGTNRNVPKNGKYSPREVIPRVIPINYGMKHPRPTYSSL